MIMLCVCVCVAVSLIVCLLNMYVYIIYSYSNTFLLLQSLRLVLEYLNGYNSRLGSIKTIIQIICSAPELWGGSRCFDYEHTKIQPILQQCREHNPQRVRFDFGYNATALRRNTGEWFWSGVGG